MAFDVASARKLEPRLHGHIDFGYTCTVFTAALDHIGKLTARVAELEKSVRLHEDAWDGLDSRAREWGGEVGTLKGRLHHSWVMAHESASIAATKEYPGPEAMPHFILGVTDGLRKENAELRAQLAKHQPCVLVQVTVTREVRKCVGGMKWEADCSCNIVSAPCLNCKERPWCSVHKLHRDECGCDEDGAPAKPERQREEQG